MLVVWLDVAEAQAGACLQKPQDKKLSKEINLLSPVITAVLENWICLCVYRKHKAST